MATKAYSPYILDHSECFLYNPGAKPEAGGSAFSETACSVDFKLVGNLVPRPVGKIETHSKSSRVQIFLVLILLLFCSSCKTDTSHVRHEKQSPPENLVTERSSSKSLTMPWGKESAWLSEIQEEQGSNVLFTNKENEPQSPSKPPHDDPLLALQTPISQEIPVPFKPQEEVTAILPEMEEEQEIEVLFTNKENEPQPPSKPPENDLVLNAQESLEKSDQEMLDSALEFCQASNDFWEQGYLDNAIAALDEAYSLILKVNPDGDPEILQQLDDLRFTISQRIIQCYSSRFTVANGYRTAIPVVMNRHVERALQLYKGKERGSFLDAYRRSGRYRPFILKVLKEAGLPEELSWLPLIESEFKIRALSRARALGIWQFVASTGYKFGLKRDRWIDERMDPERSTMAAIAYLKELHQIFGDWTTVLAAYNCGEGTVLKRIRAQRINYLDHFWDLYEQLPRETAFYVPKFLAVLHILNDPEAHGFILPAVDEEIETEEVTVGKQMHLKTISRHLGISYEVLRDLNPALRHNVTPERVYGFKVPKGRGDVLLSKLEDIPVWHPPVPVYVTHTVRKGESLSLIARRYRTRVRAIMAVNGLKKSHYIRAGWKLRIPTKRTSSSVFDSKVRGTLPEYVVQKGDSLWMIANRHGTTTKAIQSLNRLDDSRLRIGQVLKVPRGFTVLEEMRTNTYMVLKGDTPYTIAHKHGMTLSEFLMLNGLTPRSTIFPGQVVLVKVE